MPDNIHGTALMLADRGLLILGEAQSGKTSLALHLVGRFREAGRFAAFVADDQVLLRSAGGRLIGMRPAAIAGLAEVQPLGPVQVESVGAAVIDLVVGLVPAARLQRMETIGGFARGGAEVARLNVAARNTLHSAAAVLSALFPRPTPPHGLFTGSRSKSGNMSDLGLSTHRVSTR